MTPSRLACIIGSELRNFLYDGSLSAAIDKIEKCILDRVEFGDVKCVPNSKDNSILSSPLFSKLLGNYKSHTMTTNWHILGPPPPLGRWCKFPSTLDVQVIYEKGAETWQGIDVSNEFVNNFSIEGFLNSKATPDDENNYKLNMGGRLVYLDSDFRLANVTGLGDTDAN